MTHDVSFGGKAGRKRGSVVRHRLLIASLCMVTAGCSTSGGGPLGIVLFDRNRHLAGAGSLFSVDEQHCVTASFLLSAYSGQDPAKGERPVCSLLRDKLQAPFGKVNIYRLSGAPKEPKSADAVGSKDYYDLRTRNEAIDTLIAASNDKCRDHVEFLQTYQGNVRSMSGIAAQTTAILATIATGGTAQGFAAASGISSGIGSNLHQAHFANQTVALLTKSFDIRRAEQLKNMRNMMQCSPTQYSFMQAFADVQDYHRSCSIVVGLETAQEAVEQRNTVSLSNFKKFLEELPTMQSLMSKASTAQTAGAGAADTSATAGTSGAAATSAGAATQAQALATGTTSPTNQSSPATPASRTAAAPVCPFAQSTSAG